MGIMVYSLLRVMQETYHQPHHHDSDCDSMLASSSYVMRLRASELFKFGSLLLPRHRWSFGDEGTVVDDDIPEGFGAYMGL